MPIGPRRLTWVTTATTRASLGAWRLRAWYAELDAELSAAARGHPRGRDSRAASSSAATASRCPWAAHFHTYREALIIFYGHADVYLRALGKHRSERWEDWIG